MLDPIREGDSLLLRKQRGAFFTPVEVARFIADRVIAEGARSIMDPSCGEAAFLVAAGEAARDRGVEVSLSGVEIFAESARFAHAVLGGMGLEAAIEVNDFFAVRGTASVDAVIGNPPYIRYHEHTGGARELSLAAASASGVRLSELASIWAAFTVHATSFLRPGGSLGLVLPAELLSVNYAGPVRRFLADSFTSVELSLFHERVFPSAQEDVVLVIATGFMQGSAGTLSLRQVRNAAALHDPMMETTWALTDSSEKWTSSLVSSTLLDLATHLRTQEGVGTLSDWGRVSLGAVTGANKFFALTGDEVDRLQLQQSDLLPLSPPGSSHLRNLTLDRTALSALAADGARVWLFSPPGEPSRAARTYIAMGEQNGVDQAYKCRKRSPWWRVPLAPMADLFLTYMNADTPRFATNTAGLHHLNSVHGVVLDPGLRDLGRELLPLASMNSLTRLDAEVQGRAYGGGMLKIEPGEARRLALPSARLVNAQSAALRAIEPEVRRRLARRAHDGAVALVDDVVLRAGLGLDDSAIRELVAGRDKLAARRFARGRAPKREAT